MTFIALVHFLLGYRLLPRGKAKSDSHTSFGACDHFELVVGAIKLLQAGSRGGNAYAGLETGGGMPPHTPAIFHNFAAEVFVLPASARFCSPPLRRKNEARPAWHF